MTGSDISWFVRDLLSDLAHPFHADIFSLALRLFLVWFVAFVAYKAIARPYIFRPISVYLQWLARRRQVARQRQHEHEAVRQRAARDAAEQERRAREEEERCQRRAVEEQQAHALRLESEKRRLREAELEHERELARIRLEEERIAAQHAAIQQQQEAAERLAQTLADDLK